MKTIVQFFTEYWHLVALLLAGGAAIAALWKYRERIYEATIHAGAKFLSYFLHEWKKISEKEKEMEKKTGEDDSFLPEKNGFFKLPLAPVVFAALAVASILVAIGNFPLGGLLLAIALFWAWNGLHEVKKPEMAVLFAFGVLECRLNPGWYLILVPFQELEKETTARQILHKRLDGTPNEEAEISDLYYTERKEKYEDARGEAKRGDNKPPQTRQIAVQVKMRVFFRLVSPKGAIKMYGGLNSQAFKNDLDSTSKAALRTVIGGGGFDDLLTEKKKLEERIAELVNEELNDGVKGQKSDVDAERKDCPSGYVVGSIDLYFIKEEVKSKASEIREIGEANADRIRKSVGATAGPLKGNPEAAKVNVAEIWANTAREVIPEVAKTVTGTVRGRGSKKENSSRGEKSDEVRVSKEQFKQFVDNL